MPHYVVEKTVAGAERGRQEHHAARRCWCSGLSYKEDIDDDRESPSYEIIELLREAGADVSLLRPVLPGGPAGPASTTSSSSRFRARPRRSPATTRWCCPPATGSSATRRCIGVSSCWWTRVGSLSGMRCRERGWSGRSGDSGRDRGSGSGIRDRGGFAGRGARAYRRPAAASEASTVPALLVPAGTWL